MFKYFPHTDADLQAMFQKVGIKSLDDLYAEVPEQIRFRGEYQLPEEMSEIEVRQLFDKLGAQNKQLPVSMTIIPQVLFLSCLAVLSS